MIIKTLLPFQNFPQDLTLQFPWKFQIEGKSVQFQRYDKNYSKNFNGSKSSANSPNILDKQQVLKEQRHFYEDILEKSRNSLYEGKQKRKYTVAFAKYKDEHMRNYLEQQIEKIDQDIQKTAQEIQQQAESLNSQKVSQVFESNLQALSSQRRFKQNLMASKMFLNDNRNLNWQRRIINKQIDAQQVWGNKIFQLNEQKDKSNSTRKNKSEICDNQIGKQDQTDINQAAYQIQFEQFQDNGILQILEEQNKQFDYSEQVQQSIQNKQNEEAVIPKQKQIVTSNSTNMKGRLVFQNQRQLTANQKPTNQSKVQQEQIKTIQDQNTSQNIDLETNDIFTKSQNLSQNSLKETKSTKNLLQEKEKSEVQTSERKSKLLSFRKRLKRKKSLPVSKKNKQEKTQSSFKK